MKSRTEIYAKVTESIVSQLNNNVIPWRKPWTAGMPANFVTKRTYRGINTFILHAEAGEKEYKYPYWLTFNQAKQAGININKGEHGTEIIFWKVYQKDIETDEGETEKETFPILKTFYVFNIAQTNYDVSKLEGQPFMELKDAETIKEQYKDCPEIFYGDIRAYYKRSDDTIHLPDRESFESSEEYYSTEFHELIHSTGHSSRLNRNGIVNSDGFGGEVYSAEELTAEFGASFLCGITGIEGKSTVDNQVAYIQSWIKKFKDDPDMAIKAASQAQKAVDYILL